MLGVGSAVRVAVGVEAGSVGLRRMLVAACGRDEPPRRHQAAGELARTQLGQELVHIAASRKLTKLVNRRG